MKNDLLKIYALLAILITLCIVSVINCPGQTNGFSIPSQLPTSTASDWQKALSDLGININLTDLAIIIPLLYIGGKAVRNKIAPNSALAKFIANYVNFEAKQVAPPIQSPPPVVPQPTPPKTP
jgi:hypothetical protein